MGGVPDREGGVLDGGGAGEARAGSTKNMLALRNGEIFLGRCQGKPLAL
jgi:hypothetical protein